MIKLILLTLLQAILGVGGVALLTHALHGKPAELRELLAGVLTIHGAAGTLLLFSSFILLSLIVSFAKMSVYLPLNTALTFLVTIVVAVVLGHERVTYTNALGMILIVTGVALIVSKQ